MVHSDIVIRCESLKLMGAILKTTADYRKQFVIDNYEVVKTAIKLLSNESQPRVAKQEYNLIVYSLINDLSDFTEDPSYIKSL